MVQLNLGKEQVLVLDTVPFSVILVLLVTGFGQLLLKVATPNGSDIGKTAASVILRLGLVHGTISTGLRT